MYNIELIMYIDIIIMYSHCFKGTRRGASDSPKRDEENEPHVRDTHESGIGYRLPVRMTRHHIMYYHQYYD